MQLFCVLLITFPPSKNFETYLQSYMQQKTTQQQGRVDVMAKYCLRRLAFITKKGPRGKPPTIAEIETASVSFAFVSMFSPSYGVLRTLLSTPRHSGNLSMRLYDCKSATTPNKKSRSYCLSSQTASSLWVAPNPKAYSAYQETATPFRNSSYASTVDTTRWTGLTTHTCSRRFSSCGCASCVIHLCRRKCTTSALRTPTTPKCACVSSSDYQQSIGGSCCL
jgi:hypothetical protein